jgi:hypothetical protein
MPLWGASRRQRVWCMSPLLSIAGATPAPNEIRCALCREHPVVPRLAVPEARLSARSSRSSDASRISRRAHPSSYPRWGCYYRASINLPSVGLSRAIAVSIYPRWGYRGYRQFTLVGLSGLSPIYPRWGYPNLPSVGLSEGLTTWTGSIIGVTVRCHVGARCRGSTKPHSQPGPQWGPQ